MNHDLEVSRSIDINTSTVKVWKALTTPEIIKEYLYGTETVTDWKKGSPIVFQGEYEGQKYRDHGVILEIEPEKKLSYSYWSGFTGLSDSPENYSLVTCTLNKKNENVTEFTWTQKGFSSENGYNHSKEGMEAFLVQIREIAERL